MNEPCHKLDQNYNDYTKIITASHDILKEDAEGYASTCILGRPITVPTPKVFEIEIKCEINDEKVTSPRHFIKGNGLMVVSDLFLKALIKAGVDNYQAWPAILHEKSTGRTWDNYHVFNEIGLLDAISLKDCKYDGIMKGDGQIPPLLGFHEVVFSADKVKDAKMFRIPESKTDLYVSHKVMTTLRQLAPLPEKWGLITTEIEVR